VDNYATHSHPEVQAWLAKHPRFVMHFTPTGASWLNMVERFFRDITDKRIRRDSFTSVPELELAIDLYVANHNIDPKPFIWPNPSLKLTRYGRLCKPGPRQSYYRRVPGLQSLPPRAA
jgi:transposase